ncbi:hypothetical protein HK102_009809, partial [Quaeritorhiza haematococci]
MAAPESRRTLPRARSMSFDILRQTHNDNSHALDLETLSDLLNLGQPSPPTSPRSKRTSAAPGIIGLETLKNNDGSEHGFGSRGSSAGTKHLSLLPTSTSGSQRQTILFSPSLANVSSSQSSASSIISSNPPSLRSPARLRRDTSGTAANSPRVSFLSDDSGIGSSSSSSFGPPTEDGSTGTDAKSYRTRTSLDTNRTSILGMGLRSPVLTPVDSLLEDLDECVQGLNLDGDEGSAAS